MGPLAKASGPFIGVPNRVLSSVSVRTGMRVRSTGGLWIGSLFRGGFWRVSHSSGRFER